MDITEWDHNISYKSTKNLKFSFLFVFLFNSLLILFEAVMGQQNFVMIGNARSSAKQNQVFLLNFWVGCGQRVFVVNSRKKYIIPMSCKWWLIH